MEVSITQPKSKEKIIAKGIERKIEKPNNLKNRKVKYAPDVKTTA